jgi:hypothetical protein
MPNVDVNRGTFDGAAIDAKARRAANRVGLKAIRSRKRRNSADNKGGFQIMDPNRNWIVAGVRLDLSAEDVIAFCDAWRRR